VNKVNLENIKKVIRDFEKDVKNPELIVEKEGQKITFKKDVSGIQEKEIRSPWIGEAKEVRGKEGRYAKEGEVVATIHSLCLDHEVIMPEDGTITSIMIKPGNIIDFHRLLFIYIPCQIVEDKPSLSNKHLETNLKDRVRAKNVDSNE